MTYAVGPITQVSVSAIAAQLSSAAAAGGTGPYTYQWYKSTLSGFSPGGGNIISGATALTLSDTGLIPNTIYYYKIRATDTGNSNTTVDSAQLAVTTSLQTQNPNAFQQTPTLGQLDQPFNFNTSPVQIHSTQSGLLYAGAPVKIVDEAGGVPKVVVADAVDDEVFGFINYNIKNIAYEAGSPCEISQAGNVMWLYAVAPIARGAQVQLSVSPYGVAPVTSGANIVGYAYDKASAVGQLIRVKLLCPTFLA